MKECTTHHHACDCREAAWEDKFSHQQYQLAIAREALRKAVLWAECVSVRLENREGINWTYLTEAREALARMGGG